MYKTLKFTSSAAKSMRGRRVASEEDKKNLCDAKVKGVGEDLWPAELYANYCRAHRLVAEADTREALIGTFPRGGFLNLWSVWADQNPSEHVSPAQAKKDGKGGLFECCCALAMAGHRNAQGRGRGVCCPRGVRETTTNDRAGNLAMVSPMEGKEMEEEFSGWGRPLEIVEG